MTQSVLDGKKILAIDDEPDVLAVLEEEITYKCPNATFEKATTYEDAKKLLDSKIYDVVVLDIMGVRGFDLLEIAVKRNLKVAMLTGDSRTTESVDYAALLADSRHAGLYGGTGLVADWEMARRLSVQRPLILSGGLNQRNIRQALEAVAPRARRAMLLPGRGAGRRRGAA